MKKLLFLLFLIPSLAYATLTPTKVPVTKSGGSDPVLQDSDISNVKGVSVDVAVPTTIQSKNICLADGTNCPSGGGGGSQTPWTSDINGGGHKLTNANLPYLINGNNGDSYNVAIGQDALKHYPPSYADEDHTWYNTAIGVGALYSNVNGFYNVAVGFNALYSNNGSAGADSGGHCDSSKGGNCNVAIGLECLTNNTTGSNNTCLGGNGGAYHNTTGGSNVSIGGNSSANLTGSQNVAVGVGALNANLTDANTALGNITGTSITTGGYNLVVGYNSLNSITTGAHNIAIGYLAGNSLTGGDSYNVDIYNTGTSGDAGIIRIGTPGLHSDTYVAGKVHTTAGIQMPSLASTTGTRYLCIDTTGNVTSSATACSGT